MRMKLFVLLAFALGYCKGECDAILKNTPAKCLSRTTFKLGGSGGENAKENVFSCKTGLVCADTPDICADPLKFDAACSTGSCKLCTSDSPYACVSEKEFVPCSNGKLLVDFKQKCPSTAKFCGGKPASDNTNENTEEANKDPQWPCTSEKKDKHCDKEESTTPAPSSSGTEPSSTPASQAPCTVSGSFAVPTDTSCKAYIYCYLDKGVMKQSNFTCPDNYVFDAPKKRCVTKDAYVCKV
ncbi:unnamed protein product [Hermetia illucens]|uniref:Chitin-binding type-2 domain-containing protein n=1 Tax=Hermetia illucens TaxID=343691 RepID=A0A7R8ULH6_HERIL|nr:uncharacterized protein LOC119649350 [Hermetia illucens]CAD7082222.1 unnamed protein product [Hermetia illucens]